MANGYKLYRGVGGLANVDFSTVINTAAAGATTITAGAATHAASTKYTYVLRPFIDALITPDVSCHVVFETDGAGAWVGLQPAPVVGLTATVLSSSQIKLTWDYRKPASAATPATFGVYYSTAPGITVGTPDASVTYAGQTRHTKTLSLSDATTYWFAVTAITAGSIESAKREIGPFLADGSGPATPTAYTAQTFEPAL